MTAFIDRFVRKLLPGVFCISGATGPGSEISSKEKSIYVGTMDTYYLSDAVYDAEDALKKLNHPECSCQVDYGDRAEGGLRLLSGNSVN